MDIKEYWARLVAAGLAPEGDNINAVYNPFKSYEWKIEVDGLLLSTNIRNTKLDTNNPMLEYSIEEIETIQLRKDGIDLYKLEWRKPTEKDIGKMCWYMLTKDKIFQVKYQLGYAGSNKILLVCNGQIAPTEQDFIKAYGGE